MYLYILLSQTVCSGQGTFWSLQLYSTCSQRLRNSNEMVKTKGKKENMMRWCGGTAWVFFVVFFLKKSFYIKRLKSYEVQVQSDSTLFVLLKTVISSMLPVTAHGDERRNTRQRRLLRKDKLFLRQTHKQTYTGLEGGAVVVRLCWQTRWEVPFKGKMSEKSIASWWWKKPAGIIYLQLPLPPWEHGWSRERWLRAPRFLCSTVWWPTPSPPDPCRRWQIWSWPWDPRGSC